jgi:hypothetical protein
MMFQPKRPWRFFLITGLMLIIATGEAMLFGVTVGPWISSISGPMSGAAASVAAVLTTAFLFGTAALIALGLVAAIGYFFPRFKP